MTFYLGNQSSQRQLNNARIKSLRNTFQAQQNHLFQLYSFHARHIGEVTNTFSSFPYQRTIVTISLNQGVELWTKRPSTPVWLWGKTVIGCPCSTWPASLEVEAKPFKTLISNQRGPIISRQTVQKVTVESQEHQSGLVKSSGCLCPSDRLVEKPRKQGPYPLASCQSNKPTTCRSN